jgi:hypothetical protein
LLQIEARATSLTALSVRSRSLKRLDCRGSRVLELVRCTEPVAFVDVHNCAALIVLDVVDWSAAGTTSGGKATVEAGGCPNLRGDALAAVQQWAVVTSV